MIELVLVQDKFSEAIEIRIVNEVFSIDDIAYKITFVNNRPVINIHLNTQDPLQRSEKIRKIAPKIFNSLDELSSYRINILAAKQDLLALLEGIFMYSYTYEKFKSITKQKNKKIVIELNKNQTEVALKLQELFKWVNLSRDLTNEPYTTLNTLALALKLDELANSLNINSQLLTEKEIKMEEMGGLLAVNKGSKNPPRFSILDYKPDNHINEQPYVLIGKGVVMDTGGYTIKDTPNSMEIMKCDMAGAAIVASVVFALRSFQFPFWCIGLIPITDNMISHDALVPGEIIRMKNGKTVEVTNVDAEGRLILADALIYAQKYNPLLVIDIATLTGSAISTLGHQGALLCQNNADEFVKILKQASEYTYERFAELPLWPEFEDEIKSSIADLKNVSDKPYAGALIAATFLKQFITYPWIHLDVAGPVFNKSAYKYYREGATGYGVRLLVTFFEILCNTTIRKSNDYYRKC